MSWNKYLKLNVEYYQTNYGHSLWWLCVLFYNTWHVPNNSMEVELKRRNKKLVALTGQQPIGRIRLFGEVPMCKIKLRAVPGYSKIILQSSAWELSEGKGCFRCSQQQCLGGTMNIHAYTGGLEQRELLPLRVPVLRPPATWRGRRPGRSWSGRSSRSRSSSPWWRSSEAEREPSARCRISVKRS